MKKDILEPYKILVKFLGEVLGPSYEISLQDVRKEKENLISITNNHISGREVGSSLTDFVNKIIENKTYLENDYLVNYKGLVKNNVLVRSSTYFIKDEDEFIGVLSINFDSSKYQELSKQILTLCHPDELVEKNYNFNPNFTKEDIRENISGSTTERINSVIKDFKKNEKGKFSKNDRLKIVSQLDKENIFMVKGAIKEVSELIGCSEPTIYRYLNQSNKNKEEIENI